MTLDRKKWALAAWRRLAEHPADLDVELVNTLILRDELESMPLTATERADVARLDQQLLAHAEQFVRAAHEKQLMRSIEWLRTERKPTGSWWWLDTRDAAPTAAAK
jgi:hypothetical protein